MERLFDFGPQQLQVAVHRVQAGKSFVTEQGRLLSPGQQPVYISSNVHEILLMRKNNVLDPERYHLQPAQAVQFLEMLHNGLCLI